MPKVVVVVKGHHNYEPAKAFGEVVFLNDVAVNIFASSNLRASIDKWIEENYVDDDLLCLSGHLLPTAIAYHSIMRKYGRVQSLVWIGNLNHYKMVTVYDTH